MSYIESKTTRYVHPLHHCVLSQRQNPLRGPLRHRDDQRTRVRRHHAREDASVDDKQVIRAVHLRVQIDHRGTALLSTVVFAHLGAAHPVVCAARGG